ncbi:hypothetical protein ACFQ36_02810 [Arthrobacter sp. GCM10027362]|uniref:hypothetical protein n=1 Tax=Arthrobacter sp. GCM10027362 TaxID=3273379 RepID=UPI003627704F
MAPNEATDIHRTALALVRANHNQDEAGVIGVLSMVTEDQLGGFLAALAEMVHYAHASDPAAGFDAFCDTYSAAIDQAETNP